MKHKLLTALGLAGALLFGGGSAVAAKKSSQTVVSRTASAQSDLEAKLKTIRTRNGFPYFNPDQIKKFIAAGGTFEYAQKLAEIQYRNGPKDARYWPSLFDPKEIIWFKEAGLPLEPLVELLTMKRPNGYRLQFGTSLGKYDIIKFMKAGGTPEYARGVMDVLGDSTCLMDLKEAGATIDYIKQIFAIKDKTGKQIFIEGVPGISGKNIAGYYISAFKRSGGTVEYALSFSDLEGITSQKLVYYAQLQMTKEKITGFKDTDKPNAVIVYPNKDWNGALAIAEHPGLMKIAKAILSTYDVKVIVAEHEKEVYNALDSTPNTELLCLYGHGRKELLALGVEDLRGGKLNLDDLKKIEQYLIDITDVELKSHLSNLTPGATVVLFSCSNGEGGRNEGNLANFIAKMAPGRRVIAAKDPITATKPYGETEIVSAYPFDVRFIRNFGAWDYEDTLPDGTVVTVKSIPGKKTDVTYVSQVQPK